jgi:uncharacterized protein YabE (DUF348 family)
MNKDVTLVVDGRPIAMRTTSGSVQELLVSSGLPAGIQVQPPPGTALADGMTVVVSPPPGLPAGALADMVTSHDVGVWVVERPDEEPLGKAASGSSETSVSADVVGLSPVVSVRVVVSGKVHDVSTNASTTGALLSAMGITADADDRVTPPPSTPLHDDMTVRFDQVEIVVRSETVALPYPSQIAYTSELLPGQSRVLRGGVSGLATQRVRIMTIDGEERAREVLASTMLRPPVPARILAGPMSMHDGVLSEPGTGATTQSGQATWYDPPWSGLTAAHPWLPFGTQVTVTDEATGRSVTVVVDDRGPFAPGRIIDLSPEAFERLAPLGRGVLHVHLDW